MHAPLRLLSVVPRGKAKPTAFRTLRSAFIFAVLVFFFLICVPPCFPLFVFLNDCTFRFSSLIANSPKLKEGLFSSPHEEKKKKNKESAPFSFRHRNETPRQTFPGVFTPLFSFPLLPSFVSTFAKQEHCVPPFYLAIPPFPHSPLFQPTRTPPIPSSSAYNPPFPLNAAHRSNRRRARRQ